MVLVGSVVLVILGLLIANVVSHAVNRTSVTAVSTRVLAVRPLGNDRVTVTTSVTSHAGAAAQVSCLLGIERPGQPLAYPIRVNEELAPGQHRRIVVTRSLLHPLATSVRLSDVAFVCT